MSPVLKPFAALWHLFAFETPVELKSDAKPPQLLERLAQITAAPRAFSKVERRKPLRGRILRTGGFLRWPINEYRFVSPRSLHFQLVESLDGTVLIGGFKAWRAFRIIVFGWLCCDIIFNFIQICFELWSKSSLRIVGRNLLFILIGFCMAYGYAWLAVRVGRSRDRMLIKVLTNTLASATAAETVRDLLSQ